MRIEYEGGFYHITCRGNQREKIFWEAKDRERLKTILERTKERYGYLLHAFVFMGAREDDLLRWRKRTERQRRIGVHLSKVLSRKRNADIGAVFGITIQAVINAVKGVAKRREGDRRFNSELKRIKETVEGPRQSG